MFCFVLCCFVLFSAVVAFSSTILSVLPVAVVFCGLFPDVVGVIYKSGPEEKFTCSRTSCWSVRFVFLYGLVIVGWLNCMLLWVNESMNQRVDVPFNSCANC